MSACSTGFETYPSSRKYSVSGWSSVIIGPVPAYALTWLSVSQTLCRMIDTHCAAEWTGKSGAPARSACAALLPKTDRIAGSVKLIGAWEPMM